MTLGESTHSQDHRLCQESQEELASCGHRYSENCKQITASRQLTARQNMIAACPQGSRERPGVGSLELRARNSPRWEGLQKSSILPPEEKPCLCRGQQQGKPVSLESQKASLVLLPWTTPWSLALSQIPICPRADELCLPSLRPGGGHQALSECAVSRCPASPGPTHPAPVCWPSVARGWTPTLGHGAQSPPGLAPSRLGG